MKVTAELSFPQALPGSVEEPIAYLRKNAGLKNVRPLLAEAGREHLGSARAAGHRRDMLAIASSVATMEDDDLAGLAIADIDPKTSVATLRRAESSRAVDFIEPVPARWLSTASAVDPMQNLQWGLRAISWFEATKPNGKIGPVGILDTGMDTGHPDFVNVDIDYQHAGARATDIVGHGTHVAGIIAAKVNNSIGIAGVASCPLHCWKVFPDEPIDGGYYVDPEMFHDALHEASESGLSVLNMSLGGTHPSGPERILIRRLVERGVVAVAAMGNQYDDGNPTEYPAAYEHVLAVGAIAEDRERSSFSNTGRHIGICAPGSNILSTLPQRRSSCRSQRMYASWSGTSMATPHVAAAAALVAARHRSFGPADVVQHLCGSAATLPAMGKAKRSNEYGAGLLDLKAALS